MANTKENWLTVPNFISTCRIASVPIMMLCIVMNLQRPFTWLLLAALLSDIADGVIARLSNTCTRLGAFLDSMGDMGTYLSAVAGVFVFKSEFVRNHWIALSVVLGFYAIEKLSTFAKYRKPFNSFHTYLSKVTAYFQGAFVMSLFLFGFKGYLFYPAISICILANVEEIILARILPAHECDVKGLPWLIAAQRQKQ